MQKPTGAMQVTADRKQAPSVAPMSCAVSLGGVERLAYDALGGRVKRRSHLQWPCYGFWVTSLTQDGLGYLGIAVKRVPYTTLVLRILVILMLQQCNGPVGTVAPPPSFIISQGIKQLPD